MKLLHYILFGLLFFLNVAVSAQPQAILGSCGDENAKIPVLETDKTRVDRTESVRVLRQGAAVYPDATSMAVIKTLDFDTTLFLTKLSNNRLGVKDETGKILGWMDKQDLLCQVISPLFKAGLARKAFIKIPVNSGSDFQVKTSHSPDKDVCNTKDCEKLSRFTTLFIFAEDSDKKRYLLSLGYNLSATPRFFLTGWVDGKDIIPWNTNLGVRPKNDKTDSDIITGYATLEDAKQSKNSDTVIKLASGNQWYMFEMHMPLLEKKDGFYKIAASGLGMRGLTERPNLTPLSKMKHADVFFLIDGTASMQPYIKAARDTVRRIAEELQQESEFKETTFRFGFTVYRDTFADKLSSKCKNGICEQVPLGTNCVADSQATQESFKAFDAAVSKVTATDEKDDDYPEQLFAGIKATIPALSSCPENNKLIFIVGDHGDKQETLSQEIVNRLTKIDKLSLFFIQTPNNSVNAKNSETYQQSYERFHQQASNILDGILPKEVERDKHLLSLTAENLPLSVTNTVKGYSNAAVVNELAQTLETGESLRNAINKYKQAGEMPVLFWQWIEKTMCKELGEQCLKPLNHRVMEFYVPVDSSKIQEEIVMVERHLNTWNKFLNQIAQARQQGASASDKRQRFVELLIQEIQQILGDPPIGKRQAAAETPNSGTALTEEDIKNSKTSLYKLLEENKSVLPMREQSPLLQYSLSELQTVEPCEIDRLVEWVISTKSVLEKVQGNPELKVEFELVDYDDKNSPCPNLSAKGKQIKRMISHPQGTGGETSGPSTGERLGPDKYYRYSHVLRNVSLYWIPVEFLP